MADKEKREGGKSPTKFMERPGSRPAKKKDEDVRKEESHPEFIGDDLEALERQETEENEQGSKPGQNVSQPGHKGDEKPNPRKSPDPAPGESEDKGDVACP